MSTEPERDIEKTLKAYAKKRREEAGAPLELHPATRRLLQGEVISSRDKKPNELITWQQRLWGSWPRIILNTSIVLVIVMIFGSMLFPARKRDQSKADRSDTFLARNELEKAKRPVTRQEAGRALESLDGPVPAAPPQVARSRMADSEADKATPSGSAARSSATLAVPAPAAVSGAISGETSFGMMMNPPATISHRFAQVKESTFASKALNRSGGGAILNSFRVEKTGNRVRVIDSDGSVYEGFTGASSNVVDELMTDSNKTLLSKKLATGMGGASGGTQTSPTQSPALDGLAQNLPAQSDSRSQIVLPTQNYFFRVTGTNLSLKAPVVFSGSLKTDEALTAQTSVTSGLAQAGTPASPAPEKPLSNASSKTETVATTASPAKPQAAPVRLEGQVVVGGTNQIQIKALQVEP
ncbi:MAG: hypothetical protein JWR26_4130 [Pedosphaera sp.]|nr:hypothetical protein [Pedosphaera sp.]